MMKKMFMMLLVLGLAMMTGCARGTAEAAGEEKSIPVLQEEKETGVDPKENSEENEKGSSVTDRDAAEGNTGDTVSRGASDQANAAKAEDEKRTQEVAGQSGSTLAASISAQGTTKVTDPCGETGKEPVDAVSKESEAAPPAADPVPEAAVTPEPEPAPTPEPAPEPAPTPAPEPTVPSVPAPDTGNTGEAAEEQPQEPQIPETPTPAAPAAGFDSAKADELTALINAEREARGVQSVTVKDSLVEIAKEKAQNGGSGSGVMICRGTGATSASIVADSWRADWPDGTWMTSNWKYVGVACYADGGSYTWVAVFGAY